MYRLHIMFTLARSSFTNVHCTKHFEGRRVTPYVLDLGSANGTFVNGKRIESKKYVQLIEKVPLFFSSIFNFFCQIRQTMNIHLKPKELSLKATGKYIHIMCIACPESE